MAADKVTSRESVLTGLNELIGQRDTVDLEREIRRLSIALGNAAGKFGLFFAVCNNRRVEDYVSAKLLIASKGPTTVELHLKQADTSLLDALSAAPSGGGPLIVHGLQRLLPSSRPQKGQRDRILQEMQLRREQFRELARPVLLWMPEYAYRMVGQKAVDFWSWQTGGYFFPDELPESGLTQTIAIGGDVSGSTIVTGRDARVGQRRDVESPEYTQREQIGGLRERWLPVLAGRAEEVAELKARLRSRDTRAVLVSGMAGIGKTVLAMHVGSELRGDFPDGTVFVSLRQDDLTAAMRSVVSSLGASARIAADEVTLRATYHAVLNRSHALLIFDDVAEPRAILPILPEPPSKAIITSRVTEKLPRVASLVLDALSPAEAVALLRSLVGIDRVSDQELEELASLLDYLPLALSLAGSLLRARPELNVGDFRTEVESYQHKRQEAGAASSLDASLQVAWDDLRKDHLEFDRRWLLLSVFSGQFSESAAGAIVYGKDFDEGMPPAVRDHLAVLTHRGFVNAFEDGARYQVPVPIRHWAVSHLTGDEADQASLRHAHYYLQVLQHSEELFLEGGDSSVAGLDLFDRERPNIEAAWLWAAEHDAGILEIEELCSGFADAAPNIVRLRLHPDVRLARLHRAVDAAERLGDKGASSRHLASLGNAAAEQARFEEARKYLTRALSISRDIGDRRSEDNALLGRAVALAQMQHLDEATVDLERLLRNTRETGDRRGEMFALHNLGRIYADRGILARAVERYEQALTGYREVADGYGEGLVLADLGAAYRQQGNLEKAVECLQAGLSISQRFGDRRREGSMLAELGMAFENIGSIDGAIQHYQKALSIARETGGRSEEAQVLGNLGLVYARQGDFSLAQSYLQEALARDEELLGPNHPRVATDVSNIGLVLQDQGDLEGARAAFERALAIDESALGTNHPNVSIRLNNLGSVLLASGETLEARDIFERSLAIASRTMGPEHTFSGTAQLNLGLAHRVLGESEEAKRALARALSVYEQALGPDHPDTRRVREIIESQVAY